MAPTLKGSNAVCTPSIATPATCSAVLTSGSPLMLGNVSASPGIASSTGSDTTTSPSSHNV